VARDGRTGSHAPARGCLTTAARASGQLNIAAHSRAVRWAALAAVLVVLASWIGTRLRRSWEARVAVAGRSMEPALEPGDWLLVDPRAYIDRPPKTDQLVLAPDPRDPTRLLIKRVGSVAIDGRLELLGDAADISTDSRMFGSIDVGSVRGRPWFRYWPPARVGRV
jgi:nickel-type superoxide dismutase maturation protease